MTLKTLLNIKSKLGVFSLTISLLLSTHSAFAEQLIGQASVIDGDTIEIHDQRIRLHGIDAPESGQTCRLATGEEWACGKDAAFALDDHIGSRVVACDSLGTDRYQRVIGRCHVGRQDLQTWMVRNGWAMAYRRYSTDYVSEEDTARNNKVGIWQGKVMPPWEWRRGNRLNTEKVTSLPKLSPKSFQQSSPIQISQACCKYCRKGKACGDSCISRKYTCRKPPGCACDSQ